jgi:hypothetical protein
MPTFGAGTPVFTVPSGWAFNGKGNAIVTRREKAYSKTSNAIASNLFDARKEISENFVAIVKTGPTLPANLGVGGLLNINVTTNRDQFARLTQGGHTHEDGEDGTLRQVAHGITMERGFGASEFGSTGVSEIIESSVVIECDHAESPDKDGDTAQGENYDPRITLTITAYDGYATPPTGFEVTEEREGTDAEGFATFTTVATKDLAFPES